MRYSSRFRLAFVDCKTNAGWEEMKITSVKIFCIAFLFLALPKLACAITYYDLAVDAEITEISNSAVTVENKDVTGSIGDGFYIITKGGSGDCIGKPILFQSQHLSAGGIYRAFMLAQDAFTHGLRVHVNGIGTSPDCKQGVFIQLKK